VPPWLSLVLAGRSVSGEALSEGLHHAARMSAPSSGMSKSGGRPGPSARSRRRGAAVGRGDRLRPPPPRGRGARGRGSLKGGV
jgi:hypothetical protein